jgi:hypothetical protein
VCVTVCTHHMPVHQCMRLGAGVYVCASLCVCVMCRWAEGAVSVCVYVCINVCGWGCGCICVAVILSIRQHSDKHRPRKKQTARNV